MSWNSFWGGVGDWFKKAGDTVWNGVKSVANGVGNAVKGVVSTVSDVLNKGGVAQALSSVPVVGAIVNTVAGVSSVADSVLNNNANQVQEQAIAQATKAEQANATVSEAIKSVADKVATGATNLSNQLSGTTTVEPNKVNWLPWAVGGGLGLGALLLLRRR